MPNAVAYGAIAVVTTPALLMNSDVYITIIRYVANACDY